MPSIRSRLFTFVLRYGHLLRGQLKRTSLIDRDTSIPELRRQTSRSTGLMGRLPEEVQISAANIDGLNAEWLELPTTTRDCALLYFHGGGYVIGSAESHRAIVAKYVVGADIPALVPDYRLAPEHPYPAALDDAIAAYCYLLDQGIAPERIVIGGDSAGGGLCLSLVVALRDQGISLPAGAFVLSPWTDLANTGASLESNVPVDMLTWRDSWAIFSEYYVGDHDPTKPWISPLYADMQGLPPLQIYVGNDELLRDDSVRFAEKAKAAGVDVRLTVGEGLFHCYPVCAPIFPEATAAMSDICAFIKTRVEMAATQSIDKVSSGV